MRLSTLLILFNIISTTIFGQIPAGFNFQGVARNASGVAVANQNVGIRLSIIQSSATGATRYTETHNVNTTAAGLFDLVIGKGIAVSGKFADLNWEQGPYFLKTEIDLTGGSNYQLSGTTQLMSVPYSMHAKTAETIVGGNPGGNGFMRHIGEQYGGGVIFHLWKDANGVEHGLIVCITDQGTSVEWSNVTNGVIGTAAQKSWDGLGNSNAIVTQIGHTSSAAKLCLDLSSGGQSDWYLPSIDELGLLWQNRFNVNKTLSTISGASLLPIDANYWSSTEFTANVACIIEFTTGSAVCEYFKYFKKYVRSIRAF